MRHSSFIQEEIAKVTGLDPAEIATCYQRRNPKPAMQRLVHTRLLSLLERLDRLPAEDIDTIGPLLHAYHGRDRMSLAVQFFDWVHYVLSKNRLQRDQEAAVVMSLHSLAEEIREVEDVRRRAKCCGTC